MWYLSDFSTFNALKNLVLKKTWIKRPSSSQKYLGNRWVKVKEVITNSGNGKSIVEQNPKLERDLATYEFLKNRTRNSVIPKDLIITANKTSRGAGNVSAKAITPKYVLENVAKDSTILDFGSGSKALHSQMLRENGFKKVTSYEFGINVDPLLHDPNALKRKYQVVFASNVLNTQGNDAMLNSTLKQIANSTEKNGQAIFNLPLEPRYGAWNFTNEVRKAKVSNSRELKEKDVIKLEETILKYFERIKKVKGYGNNQAPLFIAYNPKV